jgi:hypothetical protein
MADVMVGISTHIISTADSACIGWQRRRQLLTVTAGDDVLAIGIVGSKGWHISALVQCTCHTRYGTSLAVAFICCRLCLRCPAPPLLRKSLPSVAANIRDTLLGLCCVDTAADSAAVLVLRRSLTATLRATRWSTAMRCWPRSAAPSHQTRGATSRPTSA